jgi:hypothetical protein
LECQHACLGTFLFQPQTIRTLNPRQRFADVVETVGISHFQIGTGGEVSFGFLFAPQSQIGQSAKIKRPRILAAGVDGFRQRGMGSGVVPNVKGMHAVAVHLIKHRVGRTRRGALQQQGCCKNERSSAKDHLPLHGNRAP